MPSAVGRCRGLVPLDVCSKISSQRPEAMLGDKALAMQAQGPEFGFLAFMLKSQTWRCVPVILGLSARDKRGSGTCWAA